jgi:hypothetical protein
MFSVKKTNPILCFLIICFEIFGGDLILLKNFKTDNNGAKIVEAT